MTKLYFAALDKPTCDWKFAAKIVEDSVEMLPERLPFARGTFTFNLKMSRREAIRIKQELGLLRRPKYTYRTNLDFINKRRYNGRKRPKK